MTGDRVAEQVHDAFVDGRLVRVTRRKGWDRLDGCIVRFSERWVLMAVEFDAGFNGHAIIRRRDVRRVEAEPGAEFLRRALLAEGHWPLPRLDGIDLTTTRSVLRSAARLAPLVSVHDEQEHPDECLIGMPHAFEQWECTLQNVTPTAEWDGDSVIRYRSVTRVDLGGAYERRLAAVAGAAPCPVHD